MIRIGIIGAGGISIDHLKAFPEVEGMKAVAVVDINEERAKQLALEYGVAAYTDYRTMIEVEKPDAVIITLPHFLHKPVTIDCAERGCHIYLEKPMALDAEECDEIIAAAERNNVKLMVGHTQHYLPCNRKAKTLIQEGSFGKLIMINDQRHGFYFTDERPQWFVEKAKSGGGVVMNLGSHMIDRIQWLTDSKITRVKGEVTHFAPKGDVEGSSIVYAETSIGVPAVMCQSGYPSNPRNETELIFTNGMIKTAGFNDVFVSRGGKYEELKVEDKTSPFVLQLLDFQALLEKDVEPYCTGAYAKSVINAVLSVYRSSELGTDVEVPQV